VAEAVVDDFEAIEVEEEDGEELLAMPPLRFDRAVLERWAAWDARFGILPRRPNVARLFDLSLAAAQGKAD